MSVMSLLLLAATAIAQDSPATFTHDFREARFPKKQLQLVGRDATRYIKPEPAGLRIKIPAGEGQEPSPGVKTRFRIRGDFEITVTYEFLQPIVSKSQDGMKLSIYIKRTENNNAASIERTTKVKGGDLFVAHRAFNTTHKKRKHETWTASSSSLTGVLRLKRVNSTLTYLAADGSGKNFKEIVSHPWDTGEIDHIKIGVDLAHSPLALDARLLDVTITAQELPSGKPPPRTRLSWRHAIGGGVVTLILASIILVRWKRTQKLK